jgi:serine/threonine-protein kinase
MVGNSRVSELIEEMLVLGRTPEEVCRDFPELLPEVRQRWQQCRIIDAAVEALFPEMGIPPAADATTPVPYSAGLPQVPGYEVEAVLGRGGMGVVYKARHLRLNRSVALKMLLAGAYACPHELARFQREAEAVAALRHPNIVQVHDVGDLEGLPFFTMEFVEGGSLARKLAGQPQPARWSAELVATLAGAVQLAHASGIIHRDLKPANILLTADGTPRITDFGLARRVEGGPEFTISGAILGTPSYMAPEQALGKSSAIGPAVDIYALGAILYELLTGRPPFRAETAAETVRQVMTEEPAPPSRLNAKVPRDLETICLKCLHKSPSRRYASARELADDLRRFLDGKPVRARPVGVTERALKWVRRRPAAALLMAALLVLVGTAVGTGLWLRQQETEREGKARTAISMALKRADDFRREEKWQEALLILTEASTHLAAAPQLEERLKQAQADLRFAADLEHVRGSSPLEPNGAFYHRQREAAFRKAFARAGLTISEEEPVADYIRFSAIREQLVAAVDDWAVSAFMLNNGPVVERLLRIARLADPEPRWRDRFRDPTIWSSNEQLAQLAEQAFNASPSPTGHQLALLSLLLRRAGARSQSSRLLAEACRRQPGNFWLNREMGDGLFLDDLPVEAAAFFRAAIALRPDNASAHDGLGRALFAVGQMDDALAEKRRMVELSPLSRSTHGYLVGPLALIGRWAEAAEECRLALEANPTDYLPPYLLGQVLLDHHRDEDAIVFLRKARDTGTRDFEVHSHLGVARIRTGRHEEAVTALRKATELIPADTETRLLLARELTAVGRPEEAIAELQSAIAAFHGQARTVTLYTNLGALLQAQGRSTEAATAFRKAADLDPRNVAAWDGLSVALLDQGHFADARAATEHLAALPAPEAARGAPGRRLDLCDALLAVDADLPAILAGQERPGKVATQRALAEWCLKHRRLPVAAAEFYAAALSAQPSLADDLEVGNRFDAACAAALAGCGAGADAAKLDDRRRAVLRRQALDWLTAEYNACAERHRLARPGTRTTVAAAVRSWKHDAALAGVRDEQALARFPLEEQRAWQTFWAKVTALAARDPVALFDRARAHVARCEWGKAAACYTEGFELEPTEGDLWFEYAAVQLLAKDRAGYRRTCAHLLDRCQAKQIRPYVAARACTLGADSQGATDLPSQLSREELQQNATAFWSLTEQGALHVRARRFQQAIPLLERSLAINGRPGRAVLNWLWLAVAYGRLGQAEEARRWLARATGWLDQQGDWMPRETLIMGLHRHDWLEAHILRREAELLTAR